MHETTKSNLKGIDGIADWIENMASWLATKGYYSAGSDTQKCANMLRDAVKNIRTDLGITQ